MQGSQVQPSEFRHRFRSFKYSISRKTSEKKHDPLSKSTTNEKKDSLINIDKLGSVLKMKNLSNNQSKTINLDDKKDIYVRTFTTFFSRNYPMEGSNDEKENLKFKILIPEYDHSFDGRDSDFTFLDTMVKPVKYIDDQLHLSEKELKRQRNDVLMLRSELNALKNGMTEKLEEIASTFSERLGKLKESFHRNEVLQHEHKLRNRKEMNILERGHELDMRKLQNLKDRNLQIQQRIFNCHPFQLQYRQPAVLQINEQEYL